MKSSPLRPALLAALLATTVPIQAAEIVAQPDPCLPLSAQAGQPAASAAGATAPLQDCGIAAAAVKAGGAARVASMDRDADGRLDVAEIDAGHAALLREPQGRSPVPE